LLRNSAGQFARRRRPVEGPVPERRSFLTLQSDRVLKGCSPPFCIPNRARRMPPKPIRLRQFDENFRQIRIAF
jgi:hypothetical protein